MLRLIFTMLALLALLCVGAVWVAAQPSGSELRAVMAPVLSRGLELAGEAGKRVALTPTASGIWEPEVETEAGPAQSPAKAKPSAPRPEPQLPEPEEILLEPRGRFVESPPEEPSPEPPPDTDVAQAGPVGLASDVDGVPRDQEGWAALIRRMLVVHRRVSGSE